MTADIDDRSYNVAHPDLAAALLAADMEEDGEKVLSICRQIFLLVGDNEPSHLEEYRDFVRHATDVRNGDTNQIPEHFWYDAPLVNDAFSKLSQAYRETFGDEA